MLRYENLNTLLSLYQDGFYQQSEEKSVIIELIRTNAETIYGIRKRAEGKAVSFDMEIESPATLLNKLEPLLKLKEANIYPNLNDQNVIDSFIIMFAEALFGIRKRIAAQKSPFNLGGYPTITWDMSNQRALLEGLEMLLKLRKLGFYQDLQEQKVINSFIIELSEVLFEIRKRVTAQTSSFNIDQETGRSSR